MESRVLYCQASRRPRISNIPDSDWRARIECGWRFFFVSGQIIYQLIVWELFFKNAALGLTGEVQGSYLSPFWEPIDADIARLIRHCLQSSPCSPATLDDFL
jgi:hypothetical protein